VRCPGSRGVRVNGFGGKVQGKEGGCRGGLC
jgi:hypothetical protein